MKKIVVIAVLALVFAILSVTMRPDVSDAPTTTPVATVTPRP